MIAAMVQSRPFKEVTARLTTFTGELRITLNVGVTFFPMVLTDDMAINFWRTLINGCWQNLDLPSGKLPMLKCY